MTGITQLIQTVRCPGDRGFIDVQNAESVEDKGVNLSGYVHQGRHLCDWGPETGRWKPVTHSLIAFENTGSVIQSSRKSILANLL